MRIILKNAKIIDRAWQGDDNRYDIAINKGVIEAIEPLLNLKGYQEISSENLHVSIGFFDIGTQIGEPGLEHRENIESISAAAAAGGYTGIAAFPNTDPPIHSKSEIQFIVNNTVHYAIDFHPIGAISKYCKGDDITEMIDMHKNGAIAFSDGKKSIQNSGLMLRALQYSKACDGLIINHPDESFLSLDGQIHEGTASVSLGLEGLPDIAESLGLIRDLELTKYAEGKYCAYNISSKKAVKILKNQKVNENENISSTVNYLNLIFDENDLFDFKVNLKVNPPLRSELDKKALISALKEDFIDAITSGHLPLEEELKKMSFAFASFGATGIETVFSAILTKLNNIIDLDTVVSKLTIGPRKTLGLQIPQIKIGETANLCFFDPDKNWTYSAENCKSRSLNSPFLNFQFKGKVIGIFNKNKLILQ